MSDFHYTFVAVSSELIHWGWLVLAFAALRCLYHVGLRAFPTKSRVPTKNG